MDRHLQKEHLGAWLSQLNDREQKSLRLRFGLEGSEPLTLAEAKAHLRVDIDDDELDDDVVVALSPPPPHALSANRAGKDSASAMRRAA